MNRTREFGPEGLYSTDDSSHTGLDVFRRQDKTAPPPSLSHGGASSKGDLPTIWSYYSQRGEHYDKDLVDDANNTVEVLLIFAGLFSAVVTAFISQTYPLLQPDPNDILVAIYQELRRPGSGTDLDQPFEVPSYAIRVNCFLFAGLFTSLLVALLGILVKQWMRSYVRNLAGVSSPHLRARIRHFRYNGARRWHLTSIVGLLSVFMHLALFISAIGIIDLLFSTSPIVGYVAASISSLGAAIFFATTLLPLWVADVPFRSPLSDFLSQLRSRIRRPMYIHSPRNSKIRIEDGGLEDNLDEPQQEGDDENIIVRSKVLLDLDIICHLLETADKSTERWLLDLCFEKLPELRILEQQDSDVFFSRSTIIDTYNFLARGCTMANKRGGQEIHSDRFPRAKQLCRFLAWYLLLPRTENQWKRMKQRLRQIEDPKLLPTLLSEDESISNRIAALTLLVRLERFTEPTHPERCSLSSQDTQTLMAWPEINTSDSRDEKKVRHVTLLLIKGTDSILLRERERSEPSLKLAVECQISLTALQQGFQKCNPVEKDKKFWTQYLLEKEAEASLALKDAWFAPLRKVLDGLQFRRTMPPFRAGESLPSGAGGLTLQPPRMLYGAGAARGEAPTLRLPGSPESTPSSSPITTSYK